jgi:hypothetical protein
LFAHWEDLYASWESSSGPGAFLDDATVTLNAYVDNDGNPWSGDIIYTGSSELLNLEENTVLFTANLYDIEYLSSSFLRFKGEIETVNDAIVPYMGNNNILLCEIPHMINASGVSFPETKEELFSSDFFAGSHSTYPRVATGYDPNIAPVPEPSTTMLILAGLFGIACLWKRKKQ